jgi:hypothetical protein
LPPLRSTIAQAPTTIAPAARATSIVSRVDPPVVTTSSTTDTFSPGSSAKPRRSVSAAVLALREDGADAERPPDFLADHDAADRRRTARPGAQAPHDGPERRAERLRFARVLKHQRTLEIAGAVQS